MYFWRIEKLKQEMAERPLSDRQALPYLVAFCALYSAASYVPSEPGNFWDVAGAIWGVLITILGTIYLYRQNGGNDGRHFLQRYLAIGWVVGLRWLVIAVFCLVAFYAAQLFLGAELEETQWYDFLFVAGLETGIYWRTGHHVRDLALKTKAVVPPLAE